MASSSEEVQMAVDQEVGRRRVLANLQCGVFLKQVFFLSKSFNSFFCVGIFECLGNSIGFYFKPKSKNHGVLFDYDTFNRFKPAFLSVTDSLDSGKQYSVRLESGEDIKTYGVFGRRMVSLYDGFQTCTLDKDEWSHFMLSLQLVNNCVAELYPREEALRSFIFSFIKDGSDSQDPPPSVPVTLINRLVGELEFFLHKH